MDELVKVAADGKKSGKGMRGDVCASVECL